MINKLRHLLRAKRGFTLVETLVAVFILMTSIAAPLTVASRALMTALVAKDQITAFYLAQDAVEYIRFARDTNKLVAADWLTGQGGTGTGIDLTNCISSNGCYLDSTSQNPITPTACATACSTPLASGSKYLLKSNTGQFAYSGSPTIYVRKVTITPIAGTVDEVLLTVYVYWADTGYVTRQVVIKENLFNWQ